MSIPQLGRLRQVDPRQAWQNEAYHFTPWLAEEHNLSLLGDALGIDLELVRLEAGVGSFSADILARDTSIDSYVVIENQLESTDHSHLGQLITYASGLDASTIVWISRTVREEHRQALDWLNSHTHEQISFFAVEVELWQIGESELAPRFNVVSRPNTFQKLSRQAKEGTESATNQFYLEFFSALSLHVEEVAPDIKMMNPLPQNWTNISIGRSKYHLRISVSLQKKRIVIDFVAYDDVDKNIADLLELKAEVIRSRVPEAIFNRKQGRKESSVEVARNYDISNRQEWPEQFEWITREIQAFYITFKNLAKELP